MDFFKLGMDSWYSGRKMPDDINIDQQRDWIRGWRTIDRREDYRMNQSYEEYDIFSD